MNQLQIKYGNHTIDIQCVEKGDVNLEVDVYYIQDGMRPVKIAKITRRIEIDHDHLNDRDRDFGYSMGQMLDLDCFVEWVDTDLVNNLREEYVLDDFYVKEPTLPTSPILIAISHQSCRYYIDANLLTAWELSGGYDYY